MHDVYELLFAPPPRTRLWFSAKAMKAIKQFRRKGDPNGAFWKKVQRCAADGFPIYEVGSILKLEWGGVYRFGIHDSLFRMIGFYGDDSKQEFIVIDTLMKKGQALTEPDRARIQEVVRIKKKRLWRKVSDEQDSLHIAE